MKSTQAKSPRSHRFTRHSLRSGFTAYIVLSPVTGLVCHRRLADTYPRNLTPASGRQDHTTSPSASAPLVLRHCHVHRIPHPTSVTIAKRPSRGGGTESIYFCFYPAVKRNFGKSEAIGAPLIWQENSRSDNGPTQPLRLAPLLSGVANTRYFFCRVNSFFRSMFIPKAPGLIFKESTKRRGNDVSGSLLTVGSRALCASASR
jgi:hypothetical protein